MYNLDHHGEGTTSETPSACEQALEAQLPKAGSVLATIRLDKDSLLAMAILQLRRCGQGEKINYDLVKDVGKVDRLGPKVMSEVEKNRDLIIALDVIANDFNKPISQKVSEAMSIVTGEFDRNETEKMVANRDKQFEEARQESSIKEIIPGKLVFVESKHRFATQIGYELASTIIAMNPEMPILERQEDGSMKPSGKTYRKYTICRYDEHTPTDIDSILRELQSKEAGWGGRADIIGSPQNQDSKLSPEEVIEIVKKYVS